MRDFALFLLAVFFTCNIFAQEQTEPKDFDLPENTVKAMIMYGTYSIPQETFSVKSATETYTFKDANLINYVYDDKPNNTHQEDTYAYENGELKTKEEIRKAAYGMSYETLKYRTEVDGNKTTFFKVNHDGKVERNLSFYNDEGELRGTTYYNSNGEKTRYTEYGGSEGHRTKKYYNGKLTSLVTYLNNADGKLEKIIEQTVPGNEDEPKIIKTISYNDKGDPVQMLQYHPSKDEKNITLNKTYYMDYLYDGDVWVAKIEYNKSIKVPGHFNVTTRAIVTTDKTYKPQSDEAISTFCKKVYQHYLTLKP